MLTTPISTDKDVRQADSNGGILLSREGMI